MHILQSYEEIHVLHSSRNIVRIIQSTTLKRVVKYAWKGRGNLYRDLAEDLKDNRPLGISQCKFENSIQRSLKDTELEVVERNHPNPTYTSGGLL